MTVHIPKVMKMTPVLRKLFNVSNYLSSMHSAYKEMFGVNTEMERWYHNGYAALTHHLYENILK